MTDEKKEVDFQVIDELLKMIGVCDAVLKLGKPDEHIGEAICDIANTMQRAVNALKAEDQKKFQEIVDGVN